MESPFSAYPAGLHCGISRSIDALPPLDGSALAADLSSVAPPDELVAAHDARHITRFGLRLGEILKRPVVKVETGAGDFYSILGCAVFCKGVDGSFRTASWSTSPARTGDELVEFVPRETPILDFPRTDLWQRMIRRSLDEQALDRIADPVKAEQWGAWAWAILHERLLKSIDLSALRASIRAGLELDRGTVTRLRKACGAARQPLPSVCEYNTWLLEAEYLDALWQHSPLLAIIGSGLDLSDARCRGSQEPLAVLKRACAAHGIKPLQWRLLAHPESPLLPLYRSFVSEFSASPLTERVADFLSLIRMLGLSKPLPLNAWRSFLSMVGTRNRPEPQYARALAPVAASLQHMVRLIERGAAPVDSDVFSAQVHDICAWIADNRIQEFCAPVRRLGWRHLRERGFNYAEKRRYQLALEAMHWDVPIHPMTVGEFTAIPLASGKDLWDESVAMRHCADLYAKPCQEGTALLFSVRAASGARYATIALTQKDGVWSLLQACGHSNSQVGPELDELVEVLLVIVRAVHALSRQIDLPEQGYRIHVQSNHDLEDRWTEGVHATAEAALDAARRVCRESLSDGELSQWLMFGECASIEAFGGAPEVFFSAHVYVSALCGRDQSMNLSGESHE